MIVIRYRSVTVAPAISHESLFFQLIHVWDFEDTWKCESFISRFHL
jgi:hypothetical protein